MVYEGRRSRGGSRRQTRQKRRGGTLFAFALWALFIALAVRVLFPETAENIKSKALEVIGADYAKAVRVFGEELGDGAGVVGAAKEAIARAFKPEEGQDIEVNGDGDEPDGAPAETQNSADMLPVSGTVPDVPASDGPDTVNDVEAFKEAQAKITDMAVPANVTYEKPELALTLLSPTAGPVTSGFGYRAHPSDGQVRFHYGVDIGAQAGSEVLSIADGSVTAVGDSTSYGLYVIVAHEDGAESLYAHMSEVSVSGGQAVKAGDVLGRVGDTGNATSECLHMELLIDGNYVNPEYYLDLK